MLAATIALMAVTAEWVRISRSTYSVYSIKAWLPSWWTASNLCEKAVASKKSKKRTFVYVAMIIDDFIQMVWLDFAPHRFFFCRWRYRHRILCSLYVSPLDRSALTARNPRKSPRYRPIDSVYALLDAVPGAAGMVDAETPVTAFRFVLRATWYGVCSQDCGRSVRSGASDRGMFYRECMLFIFSDYFSQADHPYAVCYSR